MIAHTRTFSLFPFYAARITLHQAHLAHATNQHDRALACYRTAAYLDSQSSDASSSSSSPSTSYGGRTGGFVRVAARAGEVGLLLGLRAIHRQKRTRNGSAEKPSSTPDRNDMALDAMAREVANECKLYPGTLAAVGKVIEATLSSEIVKAKFVPCHLILRTVPPSDKTSLFPSIMIRQRLKVALDIATGSTDNHLRALVIALTSAHYVHTASDHAQMMLATAQQLAAGMGAPVAKNQDGASPDPSGQAPELGNAPLGLWVGERFHGTCSRLLQLHRAVNGS